MRRANHLFERIADWDNLRIAVAKALRGKRRKTDAKLFVKQLDRNLERLRNNILSGAVVVGNVKQFTIYDPKERLITAPCFEERVLHHAILNQCEPSLEMGHVFDTYACRVGKGREACLHRAQAFSRRFEFFLKLDVRKYFDSIEHCVLLRNLSCRFKETRLLALLAMIIGSYSVAPGRGLPIGSLTSQHFANFYLGSFDRFLLEDLRVSGFVRYMDDIIVWGATTKDLRTTLQRIEEFLESVLQLALKPIPFINRCQHGIGMLGAKIYPSHIELSRRSKKRFKSKLTSLEKSYQYGEIAELQAQSRANSLVAFTRAAGTQSWRFRSHALQQLTNHDQGY